MYKFATDNALLPHMTILLSLFQSYNISPIFVFDGKAPIEKRDLLQKRRQDRWEAKNQCTLLLERWNASTEEERGALEEELLQWKRRAVYLSYENIMDVKKLIGSFGYTIIEAEGEADEECALLVKRGKVWACMSEDMDMFVYGCERIVRNVQLNNAHLTLYSVRDILHHLGFSQEELREICVLSGTDYNTVDTSSFHLLKTIKMYKKYKYNMSLSSGKQISFYEWLKKKMQYDINIPLLLHINQMFQVT